MAVKQPSFTRSNMGEIYCFNFYLLYEHTSQIFFIEIPPCALKALFTTEIAISCKSPYFYEVK